MEEELQLLLAQLNDVTSQTKAGITFYKGRLFERDVVLGKCGVGKVNAAVCTQTLIDTFQVDTVLFTGVAGAVHPQLTIGDIVIGSDCMYHDMDARALGFALGEIPFSRQSRFVADPQLVASASKVARMLYPELRVEVGRILSGDQFIADRAKVAQLWTELGGACTEMEGAAVAHVCVMNELPFVIIRSMSDQADGEAHVDFATFAKKAAEHAKGIIRGMLRENHV
jgi:adenosylhomocysteine nucleosidase